MPPELPQPARLRYVFIDALRGIACLAVLFHHLYFSTILEQPLSRILPYFIQHLLLLCSYGVEVFFVISGFVIAHSLRDFRPTPAYVGNFILRRQLRLDPAYWATLLIVILLTFVQSKIPGLIGHEVPRPLTIAANLFYLQNITHTYQILDVAWTLCIEIQFYLAFILILCLAHAIAKILRLHWQPVAAVIVSTLGILSLAVNRVPGDFSANPWFILFWWYFAAGVLCYWALTLPKKHWWVYAFLMAASISLFWHNEAPRWVGLTTIVAIYLVGISHRLTSLTLGRPIQYLGKISYSLYLIHLPVIGTLAGAAYKLTHNKPYPALAWTLLGAIASIFAAHFFYLLIEKPTMHLASNLKHLLRRTPKTPPPLIPDAVPALVPTSPPPPKAPL